MVFHWCLSDSKSPQISKTFLGILVDLNNTVVWIVSTCPLISKSSSPFTNPLVTVPRVPMTIGKTVTFMFHSFFRFSRKVLVSIFLFVFFQFYSVVSRDNKIHSSASSLLFLLIIIRFDSLAEIRWSVYISKSQFMRLILQDRFWVYNYYRRFTPCEFFSIAIADSLSLESEWQQVPLGLQDTSQYFIQS